MTPSQVITHPGLTDLIADVLVFDVGQDLLGVYSVRSRKYVPYRAQRIKVGAERLANVQEIVSYNGNRYDLPELGRMLGLPSALPVRGTHVDMREVCWSTRILGSSLTNTYLKHYESLPAYEDTHVGSNRSDVHMTFRLWRHWKSGTLKVLDGHSQ